MIAKISQETLAEMIGTTCSRVSFFMNTFKKLSLLAYNGGLHVHSSLLNIVPHDSYPVFRLLTAQSQRQVAFVINSSDLSNIDQTASDPTGIMELCAMNCFHQEGST